MGKSSKMTKEKNKKTKNNKEMVKIKASVSDVNDVKVDKKKKEIQKKKIGWLISAVVLIIPLIILIIINKNNYNEMTSYITKNNMIMSSPTDVFKAPIYSFSVDKDDKPIDVENIEYMDNSITYQFTAANREVLEDGNVMISITCEMEAEIEYIEKDDIEEEWYYTFSYIPAISFDYYTGDIYLEKNIADSKTILMKDGKQKNNDDEMAITNLTVKNKKISVGFLNNEISNKWGSNIYDGKDVDGKRYKATNKSTIVMYYKVPKDYDGMMIAINKKGTRKELWKKDYDEYVKLVSLQEETEKGKKSKELEKIEKEKMVVHKLLDKKDEKRKEFSKDDYYVFRVIDLFKDDYIITAENNFNVMYIFGIIVLIISIITCVLMFLRKDN